MERWRTERDEVEEDGPVGGLGERRMWVAEVRDGVSEAEFC